MKIEIMSKYPPVEGGVSSDVYWTAKWLGEKGHDVVIVTDSWCVEDAYRERIDASELGMLQPKNVSLYQTNPLTELRGSQAGKKGGAETYLLSLGLEVNKKEKPDIIYSHYLFPYGMAATFLAHKTKKPLVLRHAGSDLALLETPPYAPLIEVLDDADCIISSTKQMREVFGKNVKRISNTIPPDFNPSVEPLMKCDKPVIGVVGKVDPFKRDRALLKALAGIRGDYSVWFVCDPKGQEYLESYMNDELRQKAIFNHFLPPWKMPSFFRSLDILYFGEKKFPIEWHQPRTAAEAMACGVCTLISDEIFDKYKGQYKVKDGKNTSVANTMEPESIKERLEYLLDNESERKRIGRNASKIIGEKYEQDMNRLVKIFEGLNDK